MLSKSLFNITSSKGKLYLSNSRSSFCFSSICLILFSKLFLSILYSSMLIILFKYASFNLISLFFNEFISLVNSSFAFSTLCFKSGAKNFLTVISYSIIDEISSTKRAASLFSLILVLQLSHL